MRPERWRQVEALFHSALKREDSERDAFLNEASRGDESLRREVESLIASHEREGSFLDSPAYAGAAEQLTGDPAAALVGRTISHYEVVAAIGAGGMGEVYLAKDLQLGRKVALKLLASRFAQDEERLRRFQQEARTASALNHPNILTIYEIGQVDSTPFIATEYIEGETLRKRMSSGRLALRDALNISIQVAAALSAAHAAGIVHRDIKPENLMMRSDGYVKVLDFGIAKLTEKGITDSTGATLLNTDAGVVMGTVHYMSPEQARGKKVDARTDVWSLCVVLYEMVTGHVPFAGETANDVISMILQTESAPLARFSPEVPGQLEEIVKKALRKDREERYHVVDDMLLDLKNLQQRLEFEAELGRSAESGKNLASSHSTSGRSATSKKQRSGKAISSLAILPLTITSTDSEAEYLADGIAESIINNLSQLPKLRVIPRATAFRYKGREVDPREVGSTLNVQAMLTGRVVQRGDSLNIQVELVDIANDSQVWGEQYHRKISDILAVQDEISQEISEKLRLQLTREQKKQLAKRYPENTEAYQLYLKGRYFWNKRTPENLQKAVTYYQQAVDVDPKYALAYAGLADCFMLLGWVEFGVSPPREVMPKAKAAALKALELDDSVAEAHTSLAFIIERFDWDWPAAEKQYKRAIKLNPNYSTAHHLYAGHLIWTGRINEGIAEAEKARDLNPLSPMEITELGWMLYFSRQYDRAIKQFQQTLELDPSFRSAHLGLGLAYVQKLMFRGAAELQNVISRSVLGLALAHVQKRIFREAIAEFQKAMALSEHRAVRISLKGLIHILSGERKEAIKVIEELRKLSEKGYVSAYYSVVLYLALGEKE
ncbi:MAG: protein kinase, partial [Acidobacteriota bacterium]|nr:protein kinase [Acidobacteriota bacterium]